MTETVKDEKGRSIEVAEVIGIAQSKLWKAIGDGLNTPWGSISIARAAVRSIDGRPLPPTPSTLDEVHALWAAVDETAAMAAAEWMKVRSEAVAKEAADFTNRQDSGNVSTS